MVLSDRDIKRRITEEDLAVTPVRWDNIEPSSIDLRLGRDMKVVGKEYRSKPIDLREPDDGNSLFYDEMDSEDGFLILPGHLYLGTTLEEVRLPDDLAANVLGRSSLGRLGISVHQTAGYIDPGFEGQITLEITNHGPSPVLFRPEDRICQIVFHELSSAAEKPYGHEKSQYQGQSGATPSGMQFD